VFSLLKKQTTYTIRETCPNIEFDWKKQIIDFDDMLQKIREINDLRKLEAVHHFVASAMPRLFASRRATLAELAIRIEECLRVFDREVMSAPFEYEDPVRMCRAFIDMRISLQTKERAESNFPTCRRSAIKPVARSAASRRAAWTPTHRGSSG
jgi:hypothetical protein